MTLRRRLALHYGAVVAIALCLLAGLTYHELATERRLRLLLGPSAREEMDRRRVADVLVYSLVPLILLAGWWVTSRSLRPISQLSESIRLRQANHLRDPLPRSFNGDDIDRLTESFNALTERINRSFQQIRDFTLDASHELKTPLTVMRGELESLLHPDESLTPHQRESLLSLLEEIQRITRIVDALTLLTKADVGLVTLARERVALGDLVRECHEDALILAEPGGIQVVLADCTDMTVMGDRDRLRQLLLNLVDNAVKYNRPGGQISISLRTDSADALLVITNTGAGIPGEVQRRIFDRFVRGGDARQNSIDGSGLGLSIAQWITHAHRGTIELVSTPGITTTVKVRIPLVL